MRTLIKDLQDKQECEVRGFVANIRDKRTMQFIVIKDGSGKVQVTVEKEKYPEIAEVFSSLTINSVVYLKGTAYKNDFVKMGGIEIIPSSVEVVSAAEVSPIDETSSLDLKLDHRWLDLRTDRNYLLFVIQSYFMQEMKNFLYNENFIEIHTPKIIGAASESGADVFEVKYYDSKAYLSQSPQFYKQMAIAAGYERIFELAPAFRAEKSYTSRHCTEFTSFDLEFAYVDSYEDVMNMEERMLTYGLTKVKEKYGEIIKEVFDTEVVIPTLPFPRMKLADIYDELEARYGFKVPEEEKVDLNAEAERLTYKLAQDKFGHEFMFVVGYPAAKRAFYHMRDENGVLLGFDLIWRGVEITSGAQREHRYEYIKKQAEEKGLGKDVEFYLNFFKYGCPPHGGFAIGLERLTMLLLNIPTVKEAQFIFRGPNRVNP